MYIYLIHQDGFDVSFKKDFYQYASFSFFLILFPVPTNSTLYTTKITTIITTTATTTSKWGIDRGKIIVLVNNKEEREEKKIEAIHKYENKYDIEEMLSFWKISPEGSILSKKISVRYFNKKRRN